MNFLKSLGQSCCNGLKHICGKKKFSFKLFGVPVLTITERDKYHFNVFILFLPLFQIMTGPKHHMVNILLFVWLLKIIKYLFSGWSFVDQPRFTRLAFCGKTVYEQRIIEPYKFPSTTFRDKQVNG